MPPHFWDAELAGGGALLDMASHGVEAARYVFGKDVRIDATFRVGRHARAPATGPPARTTRSCSSRFEDGRAATMDVSLVEQGRPREPLRG